MCQEFVPLWPSPLASPVVLFACPPAPRWTREDGPGWTCRRASHRPICEGIPQTMRGSLAACRRRGGERPGEEIKIHPDLGYSRECVIQGTVCLMA